ncbi:hypothetical protein [Lonepinella sp. BR2271]|uniref:hypothetical protein n=1 Tax=Lonepinella sp. BR2271 TaxID=3434550 RepID=UPI003F6DBA58
MNLDNKIQQITEKIRTSHNQGLSILSEQSHATIVELLQYEYGQKVIQQIENWLDQCMSYVNEQSISENEKGILFSQFHKMLTPKNLKQFYNEANSLLFFNITEKIQQALSQKLINPTGILLSYEKMRQEYEKFKQQTFSSIQQDKTPYRVGSWLFKYDLNNPSDKQAYFLDTQAQMQDKLSLEIIQIEPLGFNYAGFIGETK